MKTITFHINNQAYTINLGDDPTHCLENSLKKFMSTEKNLSTEDVLLAYLQKTEEFVKYQNELQDIVNNIPNLENKTSIENIKTI